MASAYQFIEQTKKKGKEKQRFRAEPTLNEGYFSRSKEKFLHDMPVTLHIF